MKITREQAVDMAEAHAEGYHDDEPREGCPECEDRPLRHYPPDPRHAENERIRQGGRARIGYIEDDFPDDE
jgi:hypothetical protein